MYLQSLKNNFKNMEKPYLFAVVISNYLDDTTKTEFIISENDNISREQAEALLKLDDRHDFVSCIYKPKFHFDYWTEKGFDDITKTFKQISQLINL